MVKYNGVWTTFKPRNSTIFSSHSNFSIIDDIMEFDNKVIVCGDLISDGGRGSLLLRIVYLAPLLQ